MHNLQRWIIRICISPEKITLKLKFFFFLRLMKRETDVVQLVLFQSKSIFYTHLFKACLDLPFNAQFEDLNRTCGNIYGFSTNF